MMSLLTATKSTASAASSVINNPIAMNASVVKTDENLDILRHDTAHLLAQSVKELYPDAQVAIGPAIENGF